MTRPNNGLLRTADQSTAVHRVAADLAPAGSKYTFARRVQGSCLSLHNIPQSYYNFHTESIFIF